jgi:hypothetical protein
MFRRYSLEYVEDTVVVHFRGDVPSRRHAWMGALDALLLAGRRRFVISLQEVILQRSSDAEFVGTVAQHVRDCGGVAVFVPPDATTAQRLLRRATATADLSLAETVESGLALLDAGAKPPAGRP